MRTRLRTATLLIAMLAPAIAWAEDVPSLLKTLQAVGPENVGQKEAARAWQKLAKANVSELPTMLIALDSSNRLASNWIRTAIDAVAERQLRRGGQLPTADLEAFTVDRHHAPHARRLAYEWLVQADSSASDRLVSGMLDDPSPEMRRDAVARLIDRAAAAEKSEKPSQAIALYRKGLTSATDVDQVRLLAERLQKLGASVDVPRQLGFIVRWQLIGPFDNVGEKGFDRADPPERTIDLNASCPGKHGDVRWFEHTSKDDFGQIDFNRVFTAEKGVTAFATTDFYCETAREVEFRLSSPNAVKLWLNGVLIDSRKIYHGGGELDQYISRGKLRAGRNTILVKVCQNEQDQDWAASWCLQLRLCDADGRPVLSTDRHNTVPSKAATSKAVPSKSDKPTGAKRK